MGNDKGRMIVRVVVALYLFYLSYQIVRDGIVSGDATGGKRVLLIIAVIGFIAAGCFFLYQSYKMMKQMQAESEQARNELAAERAEEAKAKMLEDGAADADEAVIETDGTEVVDAADADIIDVEAEEVVDPESSGSEDAEPAEKVDENI